MIGEWQYLHGGELSDMPGRCETWQASIRYLGEERWQLELSGTDFYGFEQREAEIDTITTDALVDWALTVDEMEAPPRPRRAYRPGCAEELPEDDDEVVELGPRASALLRIAELVGAECCCNDILSRI